MAFEYLTNIALHQAKQEYMNWLAENGFAPLPTWQDALSRYLKEIEV